MDINNERRKVQLEALAALEQNNYNGVLILPTGSGKSWVMIQAMKNLFDTGTIENIWYLCNSEELRDRGFVEELVKWDMGEYVDRVTRMCYQTAYKISGEKVDLVLSDEFDASLSPEYSKVYFQNEFTHKILVSATIEKDRLKLAKSIAPIVYEKTLQEQEDNAILNKSLYNFVHFTMTEQESKTYLYHNLRISKAISSGMRQDRLKFIILERKRFLNNLETSQQACRKVMHSIYNADKNNKALIFCESNSQASAICKYTYHSDTKEEGNLEMFKAGEINFLAVCGKVNRGVNISGVNNVIFESCNRSTTQVTQRLGRGKRLAIDDMLNVYFLVPNYTIGSITKPTKVLDWIYDAGKSLQLSNALTYKI